ncbi:MAG TPA: 4'-phosphopantetheinyl transferase superfamily protein [Thermoanaerobaculia bacterium]
MNGIDVWCADLDAAPPRDPASMLSAEERERAARFRFDVHRHRFARCRALLRQRLAETLGIDAAAIAFRYGAHGKPEVDGVHFNVSHSDHLAVIAISRDVPVGIDVERIDDSKELLPLGRTAFSPLECEALSAMTPREQNAAFYRTWARKEAYLKLLGTGFSRPSDSFAVSMTGEPLSFVEGCALRDLAVHPDFACAIATPRETPIALRP